MPLFQLIIQASADAEPETLQFIAGDLPGALTVANQFTSPLPAELWLQGARVCRLEYSEHTGSWVIADQGTGVAIN